MLRRPAWRLGTHAFVTISLVAGGIVTSSRPLTAEPRASVMTSPNVRGSVYSSLNAVACVTATDCWGVGSAIPKSSYRTLIEHWNGAKWSIITSPNPNGEQSDILSAVTCTSSRNCIAVGHSAPPSINDEDPPVNTLIEQWNGTRWHVVPSPRYPLTTLYPLRVLTGVSCAASNACMAVGYETNDVAKRRPLALRWNGIVWRTVPRPNGVDPRTGPQEFSGVACPAATSCFAVGYVTRTDSTAFRFLTLVEHWNGTAWNLVTSPNPDSYGSFLESVACTASNRCVATGRYIKDPGTYTLVEQWDGTSWKIVPSPAPANGRSNAFSGVACVSSTNCLAVGNSDLLPATQTLLEHWNGTTWSVVASPPLAGAPTVSVRGVACAVSVCFAVGQRVARGVWTTLIERYS